MAQRLHVPKFGNWDRENIPYTTYFDNARRGRGPGGKVINPNDPEENPAAFNNRDELTEENHHETPKNSRNLHNVGAPSSLDTRDKNGHVAQQFHREKHHHSKEGGSPVGRMKSTYQDFGYHRDNTDARRNRKNDKINASDSSTDGSNATRALMRSLESRAKKDLIEQRYEFSPSSSPQQPTSRTQNNIRVETQHQRAVSVPKFGAWDATNPEGEAGFTLIFDKVKEEKQKGANKLPSVLTTPSPARYSHDQEISDRKAPRPKMFCCFMMAS
uniref:RPM1-interacting protein 4 n=1 Tax=Anthurium amnicola TaxID=1678845 RepID=A0A1D1XNE7_9ARAE